MLFCKHKCTFPFNNEILLYSFSPYTALTFKAMVNYEMLYKVHKVNFLVFNIYFVNELLPLDFFSYYFLISL